MSGKRSYDCSQCNGTYFPWHTRASCPELVPGHLRERRARWKARMRAEGRCETCGEAADGRRFCARHRLVRLEQARRRYDRRRRQRSARRVA